MDKYIDIITTAVLRCLAGKTVAEWVKGMDRCGYKLRWLCNLDKNPQLIELYEETKADIFETAKLFDSFEYIESDTPHHGYALMNLFERVKSEHVFIIEDDYRLERNFSVDEIINQKKDCVIFWGSRSRIGSTINSYYSKKVIDYLLFNRDLYFKEKFCEIEKWMIGILRSQNFSCAHINLIDMEFKDLGQKLLEEKGIVRGGRISRKLTNVTWKKAEQSVAFVMMENCPTAFYNFRHWRDTASLPAYNLAIATGTTNKYKNYSNKVVGLY